MAVVGVIMDKDDIILGIQVWSVPVLCFILGIYLHNNLLITGILGLICVLWIMWWSYQIMPLAY